AATNAASMAHLGRTAIDGAPAGPERQRRTAPDNFLVPRGMGGSAQGKKVGRRRCAQAIEA
ncbi:MAG: hypothetical protein E6417_38985, partial [Bradyrhizobium sp.]|nr:hypothetical protein [Bradyrhizobium sp.]